MGFMQFVKKYRGLGIAAGISSAAISWLIGTGTVPVLSITASTISVPVRDAAIQQGVAPQLAELIGRIPGLSILIDSLGSIGTMLLLLLGSMVMVYVGAYIYERVRMLRFAKSSAGRLATLLIVGSIGSLVLVSVVAGSLGAVLSAGGEIIALVIYYGLVALLLLGAQAMKLVKIPTL